MSLQLREATVGDIGACALICHKAFTDIADKHNFPTDFPSPESAEGMLNFMIGHPQIYGVVAEVGGEVVGSNFLDERGEIVGVGPITVSVSGQNTGVGKALMQHCLDRSASRKVKGVRLLQAAYHNRSLSLYTSLGFDAQEVISAVQGPALKITVDGFTVRAATPADLDACAALCQQTHGHGRRQEMLDAINHGSASVALRGNTIEGFASALGYMGFAVAASNDALKALIGAAPEFGGPGMLVPTGNGEVMRWCLANGLRVVHQMTLMSIGFYQRPATPYLPSVLY